MNKRTDGATRRDYIGYAFGDFGMQAVFGLISSVLQKYYTDVLLIPIARVMMLFVLARIWDAVNDPMWGAFVDSRKAAPEGRYRRFVRLFAVPMALSTVLMFVRIPGLTTGGTFALASVTYVLFGMVYTCVNVPYGSLAAVITASDEERTKLSTGRSVGAALGTVPSLLLIMLCYSSENGVKVMSYQKILAGVILISLIGAVFCILSGRMVTERVIAPPKKLKKSGDLRKTVLTILGTRPFLVLSVSAMLYLASTVFSQSYVTYLADRYFGISSLSMLAMVAQYLPMAFVLPFMGRLNRRFGRKQLCAGGMLVSGVFYLILYLLHTANPWVFLLFCLLSGLGNAFLFLQVWALAAEVVDYNRAVKNITDDAVTYSLFSFIRKLGHAVAAVFVNASLLKIGYSANNLSEDTLRGMYASSALVPAVLCFSVFILLGFLYPLGKRKRK